MTDSTASLKTRDQEAERVLLEQFKLVYDYIKFHLGLYLATPPVFAVVAESYGVQNEPSFRRCLGVMIAIYLVSGVHAGWFMGNYVNVRWRDDFWSSPQDKLFAWPRRFMHHTLYWVGLFTGLGGLAWAVCSKAA